ncbi:MAG: alpha-ketoglutarate dehydrogenase [Burkholderiales bacterium]|nr:alpha-ketoglutarate dehydrogenase [Burkholderiales bacterium]
MTDHSDVSAIVRQALAADLDPAETREWIDALAAVLEREGEGRAQYLLKRLTEAARGMGVDVPRGLTTPYRNTIALEKQAPFPGDLGIETRITSMVRWNALAMVVRANKAAAELGGHIASYASVADLFEVGFNHFFRGSDAPGGGDLVFFQPHSAPGVYARAFLEGRLGEDRLANYRREVGGRGLSSYPHPWLMPDFWQFPTGSMGLGPIQAVYQARFMRYLEHRGIAPAGERKVWCFVGDGEMDEPESLAGLSLAAREGLDNLIFVVNCNLQRLDGPVRGNGSIVQELEGLFAGAGWNVIKLLWGSNWDALFARDAAGALARRLHETVDGEFQKYAATDGKFNREHFFNKYEEVRQLVAHMSDADIDALKRGGHDPVKIHAAYHAAVRHRGTPTVILAKTMKGYGMGSAGQARMTTHQQKKLDDASLIAFRDRFALPLSDAETLGLSFYRPPEDGIEMTYLRARRAALGGALPARRARAAPLAVPAAASFAKFAFEPPAKGGEMSSTMAFVRMLTSLTRDKGVGRHVVPIVADEARTFGMQAMFRQIGIYAPHGQAYEPEDADELLYYREARDGQILEEGITEAGALSSWIAAATSYANHGVAMLPFYIYYSIFGFQRVADLIWAAADQRARGFLIGATAGRTTLSGEGLQHQDGSSHLVAASVPNCRAYDPCYGYEVAVIVEEGMRAMLERGEDVFYYLTVMNENAAQPLPDAAQREGIVRGMYRLRPAARACAVRLLGSGAILPEVLAAADWLERECGLGAEVYSVTSYAELQREGMAAERAALAALAGRGAPPAPTWVGRCLDGSDAPVIAASDYVRAVPELIRAQVRARYVTLGTDGFGRSDTRAALRGFFEVDRRHVAARALGALHAEGRLPAEAVADAIARLGIDLAAAPPWQA